jgi:Xaa-Pro aminopeptidase
MRITLTIVLLCTAQIALSQPVVPESPVRYDTDLLAPSFHHGRRAALSGAIPAGTVGVIFGGAERNRENDVSFEYRQSSDLYYLTGTTEPGSVLLLATEGFEIDGETVTELLMVPPRNPMMESVIGRRFGVERAQAALGVQLVVGNDRYEEIIGGLADREDVRFAHLALPDGVEETSELGAQIEYFRETANPFTIEANGRMARMAGQYMMMADADQFDRLKMFVTSRLQADNFEGSSRNMYDALVASQTYDDWITWRRENIDSQYADGMTLQAALAQLRMVKTDDEIALMQRAIDITAAAHREAMKSIEPGMHEYEIEALIEYVFRRNGAEYTGFPSIVGSGENSTVLHYESNRRRMEANDVVVMDIGAEYHGYSADITRTVPVDGTFSPEQKSLYELVLRAQNAGIDASRAGNMFNDPDAAARAVISDGLVELGLIGSAEESRRFFVHGTSHYLGLYVHDVGDRGPLRPGTVITVEPGIYVPPADDVDPKWWNIGIRIEDDVLITEGDPVVLSAKAPKTVSEIETLMAAKGLGNEEAGLVDQHRAEHD